MDLKRVIIPLLLIMPFAVKSQEYWPEPSENQLTDLLAQTDEKVGLKEDETDDATLVALQMFEKGKTAFDGKEYTEAAEWYRKAAEQGLAEAQNNLGFMYRNGYGVDQDYSEAIKWYRKAVEQGYIKAQFNLGKLHELGYGVTKDYIEAVSWYRKAAEQEHPEAQYHLGKMYEQGYGVTKDYKEAVIWYRKSAEHGNPAGQYMLGYMYHKGLGGWKNYDKGIEWLLKSAEQGLAHAQYNLGLLYEYEESDLRKAKKWYRKAAKQGDIRAIDRLKELGVPVGEPQ